MDPYKNPDDVEMPEIVEQLRSVEKLARYLRIEVSDSTIYSLDYPQGQRAKRELDKLGRIAKRFTDCAGLIKVNHRRHLEHEAERTRRIYKEFREAK